MQYFEELFNENDYEFLTSKLYRWKTSQYISKRYFILADCAELYRLSSKKKNYYSVIVPTLLTQIDGMLWDYLLVQRKFDPKLNELFTELAAKNKPAGRAQIQSELRRKIRDVIRNAWLNIFSDGLHSNFINDTLFKSLFHGERQNAFNRHKILHGENTTYNTVENTLKLFLTVDFISDLFDGLDSNNQYIECQTANCQPAPISNL